MAWLTDKLFGAYRKAGLALLDAAGRRRLARLGHDALLQARPRDAKPPVWSDLWFLYSTVRERRPTTVLEFGSGCSTVILAQALADNAAGGRPGRLFSLDADPHWGRVTIEAMPAHLKPLVELAITPALPVEYDGTPAWRFRDVPDIVPDLLYLDGPALTPERKVAVDVLDLEARFPPGFRLIVDGRLKNCAFLERHFHRRYRRHRNSLLKNTVYDLLD